MGKLDKILKLRSQGKKYKEIAKIISCNISLVSYYLNHENNLKKFELKRQDESFKQKRRDAVNKSKERNRKIVVDYLKEHPCVDCGITDIRVLEFDHVKGTKIDCVSVGVKDSWNPEKLLKEIDKCKVRCANCHKIKTDERRNKTNNN